MSPRSAAWPDHMARRITRRVRRAARLSWFAALLTALGASALLLAPRLVDGPEVVEIAGFAAVVPTSPGVSLPAERSPVQVRMIEGVRDQRSPVEISF